MDEYWVEPSDGDLSIWKEKIEERKVQDEKCRIQRDNAFVEGYISSRVQAYKKYIKTNLGTKETLLFGKELKRLKKIDAKEEKEQKKGKGKRRLLRKRKNVRLRQEEVDLLLQAAEVVVSVLSLRGEVQLGLLH